MRRFVSASLLIAATMLDQPAAAHTFGAHDAGLAAGLAHPLAGLDHLIAMVAVGLWAGQLGGRALWMVPSVFITAMVSGAVVAAAGFPLPATEYGIFMSLIVIGALIAAMAKTPAWVGAALVGLFATFHGHAHGGELPEAASMLGYAAGFVAATGFLHAIGIALFRAAASAAVLSAPRLAGGAIALAGLALIAA
jgi:urease accessory protein